MSTGATFLLLLGGIAVLYSNGGLDGATQAAAALLVLFLFLMRKKGNG